MGLWSSLSSEEQDSFYTSLRNCHLENRVWSLLLIIIVHVDHIFDCLFQMACLGHLHARLQSVEFSFPGPHIIGYRHVCVLGLVGHMHP